MSILFPHVLYPDTVLACCLEKMRACYFSCDMNKACSSMYYPTLFLIDCYCTMYLVVASSLNLIIIDYLDSYMLLHKLMTNSMWRCVSHSSNGICPGALEQYWIPHAIFNWFLQVYTFNLSSVGPSPFPVFVFFMILLLLLLFSSWLCMNEFNSVMRID